MTPHRLNRLMIACALALGLPGCATQALQDARQEYDRAARHADELAPQVGKPGERRIPDIVARTPGHWIPAERRAAPQARDPREARLLARQITLVRDVESLTEVAERITQLTGVPIYVADEAPRAAAEGAAPAAQPRPGQQAAPRLIPIAYSGSVQGLLDAVAARFGVNWEYRDGRIVLYRLVTRSFVLHALPGDPKLTTKISNTGLNGSSSSASSNATEVASDPLSAWRGIEDAIKSMLTGDGRVVVSPALGTITVTDTPAVVAKVENLVEKANAHLGRQVAVQIQVLAVTSEQSDEHGIDWAAVYKALDGNLGVSLKNSFATTVGGPTFTLSVQDTATGNLGAWRGSEAMIKALSRLGRVTVETTSTSITLNGQPVPVQVGRQTGYLQSSSTTVTPNVGTTTTLTPGTVSSGFSMTLLPHILSDNSLLLHYALDFSNQPNISSVSSNGSSIQITDQETRNFVQRVSLTSGDTLVLRGYEQRGSRSDLSGVGSPDNDALGGLKKGGTDRSTIVILVRPVIEPRPATPAATVL